MPGERGGQESPPSLIGIMRDKSLIEKSVGSFIEGTDMYIVEIKILQGNVIEVVLDSDTSVGLDDCARINRMLREALDDSADDEDFELTVCSAGLTEPFKLLRQYRKNVGKEVEVIRKSGVKQRGILYSVDNNFAELRYSVAEKLPGAKRKTLREHNEQIPLDEIKSTKLHIKIQ